MRAQSISPLSHEHLSHEHLSHEHLSDEHLAPGHLVPEREWLAGAVDPSGWLTGSPAQRSPRTGGTDLEPPPPVADPAPQLSRPQRRLGRVDRAVELGGARAVSRRRRRRLHPRLRLEQHVSDHTIEQAAAPALVTDAEPDVDGYRMGRWARLALTMTVIAAAAVVIGFLVVGPAPQTLVDVTVGPGDSLWSIASQTAPDRDPRAVIEEIRELNGMTGDVLPIGVVLRVPAAGE